MRQMSTRFSKKGLVFLGIFSALVLPQKGHAQSPRLPTSQPIDPNITSANLVSDVAVDVHGPDGTAFKGQVVLQLLKPNGHVQDKMTVRNGSAKFLGVPRSEMTLVVTAPGFQKVEKKFEVPGDIRQMTITINLRPVSDAEEADSGRAMAALSPKAQKDVGKALEALRANKPNEARNHLEAAQKDAPYSAEVEYLFGVYASQLNQADQAQAHWRKTLALDPKHLSALLAVSQSLLQEKKPEEAIAYLNRAMDAEPSSWRTQALLAEAYVMEGKRDEAIAHAQRAIELGHERADSVQVLLARALAQRGERAQAINVMQDYVRSHPTDAAALTELARWKDAPAGETGLTSEADTTAQITAVTSAATALPIPSNWLPPDVDEKVPAVDAGTSCNVDEVVAKTGQRIVELVHDVDRFTATESLTDQTINKWGIASSPERRTFEYLVSIQEVKQGWLGVDEYRRSSGDGGVEFPEGIVTNGLPALVLIFHPYYSPNYEMACEGLAKWSGQPAWQVHFRQRPGKPIANKAYKLGMNGPSYPVALKGRAWISADNFQILRMETDLIAPLPEIRLVTEHTAVEYGSVNFRQNNVNLWLPQSAEVYFDWLGHRIHRRHSFSNYLLFAVDDKQKISAPKTDAPAESDPGGGATR